MPRSIQISLPVEMADAVQERLQSMDAVSGLARHPGASLRPPGDILVVQTSNDGAQSVLAVLNELQVNQQGTILTTAPTSLITPTGKDAVEGESNEAMWEEMAFHLREDTNVDLNYLAMMSLAGVVAAAGLWADALHIVIGAMVLAPAFEPLVRIPFGMIIGPGRLATRGTWSCIIGYAVMAVGGLVAVLLLRVLDPSTTAELTSRRWVSYWSSFSTTGIVASLGASLAGAIIICGLRSTMATGVMIALSLIPSMSIVGMAVATGDIALAGRGLARWAADAAMVMGAAALVIGAKQLLLHRRAILS